MYILVCMYNIYIYIYMYICICLCNHILVKTKLGHFADNADLSDVKIEMLKYASEYCTICMILYVLFVGSVRLL